MPDKFVIWGAAEVANAFVPHKLEGIEPRDKLKLWFGHDYKNDFPKGLQFTASPDYPNDLKLIDFFANTESVLPVSAKLKAFVEGLHLPNIQFIPVELLDHRRRVLSTYYLMHLTELIDCIDLAKSEVTKARLRKDAFSHVDKLVLDEKKIPADAQLFKVARLYDTVAVRRDVSKKFTAAGFKGLQWLEVGEFTC